MDNQHSTLTIVVDNTGYITFVELLKNVGSLAYPNQYTKLEGTYFELLEAVQNLYPNCDTSKLDEFVFPNEFMIWDNLNLH